MQEKNVLPQPGQCNNSSMYQTAARVDRVLKIVDSDLFVSPGINIVTISSFFF